MSDIGFQGLATAMIAVAMLAIALLGFAVEGAMLWRRRGTPRFAPRSLFGPGLYATVAIVLAVVAEKGSLDAREALDGWGWLFALVALIPWIAVHWGGANPTAGGSREEGR